MGIALPGIGARRTGSRILGAVRWTRRFPVAPLLVLFLVLLAPAIFANVLTPHHPEIGTLPKAMQPPVWIEGGDWSRPLGADTQGRDVMTRIFYGARVSLIISLIAIFLSGLIGSSLGMAAAYFGGWVDHVISRLVDISMAIPAILFALVLGVVIGAGFKTVIIVVLYILWSQYARQVRGETLAIMGQDYIARARVAGCSHVRIMTRHIFPNVFNTLVVLATLQLGFVILVESGLSFLAVGIPRPTPAWGSMIADGRSLIIVAWWISLFPGLAILLTVVSMNLLGDWLRDKLDPKLRQV